MEQAKDFRHIVRVVNTDLDGRKQISSELRKIRGINDMYSHAVMILSGIPKNKRTGELSDSEVQKINDIIQNPVKYKIPQWMFNRRKDPETGDDSHLFGSNIQFIKDQDIKKMIRMRCYRGIRHTQGLPVRGQRTKSNFRKTKSKGKGGSLGVQKSKSAKSGKV